MQKQSLSDWFVVSKKQRNGILVMLSVIVLCIIVQSSLSYFIKPVVYDHSQFEKEIAALKVKPADSANQFNRRSYDNEDAFQPYSQPYENRHLAKERKGELFHFDPNKLDDAGWKKLGVRDKTIGTIKNYLSKGGRFYRPEDIKRIWGLNDALADKLIPYIRIEKKEYAAIERPVYEKKVFTPSVIDINTADTTAFIALPGIGSKLAQRIVGFREKLGGFYSVEQLGETYGLPDSIFQKIRSRLVLNTVSVKQHSINAASLDELKSHPYIRYNIANAMVQYRKQHGDFSTLNDLKKIVIITDDIYNKMEPYLKL